ncbi:hypothetical protein [Streptomyces sp. NPDC017529]|uniref:hypothetical protein n=1 Tax=Streptomyces sp. NPDC017529 TaxID=3365000 RepID=UPI0037AFD6A7
METPEVPTGHILPNGILAPSDWKTLPDPASQEDLTPEQVEAATASTGEMTLAASYFVLRPVANHDLVVTAPASGSGPLTLARRDNSNHQQWALGQGNIGGGLMTFAYINRATSKGIGRNSTNPVLQTIDHSNYLPIGWIPVEQYNSMERIYAVATRDPVTSSSGQYWVGRRAMAPVDLQAGRSLQMVDGKRAFDTRAYHLEHVFL